MSATSRDSYREQLEKQLEDAQKELEFLNDSDDFYLLDLGTGSKTIMYIDFNKDDGITAITSNNSSKLCSAWYKNYAGFVSEDEAKARISYERLSYSLKFDRIFDYLMTTAEPTPDYHVVRYNVTGDTFDAIQVTQDQAKEAGELAFDSLAKAQQAITYMTDSATGDDRELRVLFRVITY